MKLHESLTDDRILEACQSEGYIGFCVACGEEHYSIKPDAESYTCEMCGLNTVFDAEQILICNW